MRRILSRISLPMVFLLAIGSEITAQSTEVAAAGDTISYATFGSGNTTLLLIHGWSNTRTFWEPHLSRLSEQYQVVTVDLASFGESTGHRSNWTMPSFADDVEAVLEEIHAEAVVLVGFSMGGAAAIELASRSRKEVIGVVLVDIFQNVEEAPTDEYIDGVLGEARERWHDPNYLRGAFSPRASQTLIRRYLSRTPATVPYQWWESARNSFLWVRNDLRPTLGEVGVPIAAINSDHLPTTIEAWRRYAPSFSVHILGDVNHLGSIWERVDEFDEALIAFVQNFRRSAQR